MQLIDRDAFSAEMKKRQDACEKLMHDAERWNDVELMSRADSAFSIFAEAKLTLDKMPTVDAEPKWIPCSERLPEPVSPSQRREWFVTSNQYGSVTLTCYEFEASPFKEGWQTDMTILAWMPLPEPYKDK